MIHCIGSGSGTKAKDKLSKAVVAYILRYQPGHQTKTTLRGGQNTHIADQIPIHDPRHNTQVFRPGIIHLVHDAPGNLAISVIPEELSAVEGFGVGGGYFGGARIGEVEEGGRGAGLQKEERVDDLRGRRS
jgi:hypothetical protein